MVGVARPKIPNQLPTALGDPLNCLLIWRESFSLRDEDKVGDIEGRVMNGTIDGDNDRLVLGDDNDEGVV